MTVSNADAIVESPVNSRKEFIISLFISTRINSALRLLASVKKVEGFDEPRPSHL